MATEPRKCETDPSYCCYGPHYCCGLVECELQTEAEKEAFRKSNGSMFVAPVSERRVQS